MSQDPEKKADHPRRTKNTRVMVSTEENSLSELLGTALPKGVLAGLRGVTSTDVPKAAFAAKPIEAFSYGLGETTVDALAEPAALAYTYDAPDAAATSTPARLTLVADNGAGDDARSNTLQEDELEAARSAAMMHLEDLIDQARLNGDDEGIMRLEAILKQVETATSLGAIASVQSQIGQASSGKAETAEGKRAEAWRRIEQLNSEIRNDLYDLRNPEERARAKELEEELERRKKEEERILADPNASEAQKRAAMQARIDAQQAIIANDKRDIRRIEEDPRTPQADRDKLDEIVKPKVDELQRRADEVQEAHGRQEATRGFSPQKNDLNYSNSDRSVASSESSTPTTFAVVHIDPVASGQLTASSAAVPAAITERSTSV